MTDRRVALLRGINVGRAKRVAMADLRSLFESLGFDDVRTLLNSGNVVFTVRPSEDGDLAARIEAAFLRRVGFSSRVTILTGADLQDVLRDDPFGPIVTDPSRYLVAVLNARADRERLEPLVRQDWGPEQLALGHRAAYLWCPDGVLGGTLVEAVGRALGDRVTMRNWRTLERIGSAL